jgi:uncharacterized protein DUF1877
MPEPLKHAKYVAVTPAAAARLGREPDYLIKIVTDSKTEETGLGIYWHGVQYLLAGRAQGVRGPLAWFTTGGKKVSRTPAGPVRYLSPEQVREWAAALADEPPDELGDGVYDLSAMDRDGVYPGTWVRDGQNTDPLGTMRELYSYLREFVIRQSKARKGVLVVMTFKAAPVVEDEAEEAGPEDGTEGDEAEEVEPEPAPKVVATDLILEGAEGRLYERAQAPPPTAATASHHAELAALGYQPLGDLRILPLLADGIVRTYRSQDGTVTAAAIIGYGRVASTTFFSLLAKDALVVASDAFVVDKTKRRLFSQVVSRGTPAQLDTALRERRAGLEKKFGAPVTPEATIASAAEIWELWSVKRSGTW